MRVSGTYPSFISGVSQQAIAFRLPTQAEDSVNCYPTIVRGLRQRPPTEVVSALLDGVTLDNAFLHVIERDNNQRFLALFYGTSSVKVYSFEGVEQTVTVTPSGAAYLAQALDKAADLRAVSIADYTFVANRRVTVAMASTTSPTRPFEALMSVRAGNYGRTFTVFVNGVQRAQYVCPDGSAASQSPLIDATYIASQLFAGLNSSLPGLGFTVQQFGSTLYISHATADFSVDFRDGSDGASSRAVKGVVQLLSDLPRYGPEGFIAEIVNSSTSTFDNYWARATKDPGGSAVIIWKEGVKPGTLTHLNATTMPHTLRRNTDGSWTFGEAAWDSRKSGNGDTIGGNPSFVGSTINDLTLFRQRLGFLSDENIVFSKSGSFFDFFRTTGLQVLDEDPIDISVSHDKVSILRHALPHQDSLFLFSGQTQFRVGSADIFTPKTAAIRAVTEYSCSPRVRPASIGSRAYFLAEDIPGSLDSFASVYEVQMDNAYQTVEISEVTSHIPSYIPGGATQMAGCADENMLFILTDDAVEGVMYVHRWFWAGDEKVQNAFFSWKFPGAKILGVKAIASTLFMFLERSGRLFLEKIRLNPDETEFDLPYQLGLDRKVAVDAGGLYNPIANVTQYQFTFAQTAGLKAISVIPGTDFVVEREVVTIAGADVFIRGDTTAQVVYFGYPFTAIHRLTPPVYRGRQADAFSALPSGRLQVAQFSVQFDRSGYFKITVNSPGRPPRSKEFSNRVVGDPRLLVGISALRSGRLSAPILCRSEDAMITLESSSYLPFSFLSGEWEGVWNSNSKQV